MFEVIAGTVGTLSSVMTKPVSCLQVERVLVMITVIVPESDVVKDAVVAPVIGLPERYHW